ALAPSAGTLSPTFDTNGLNYALQVSLFDEQVQLTPAAPEGAQITINGQALTPGDTWTSPTLEPGENIVEIDVVRAGNIESVYAIMVVRGEPQLYVKGSHSSPSSYVGGSVALSSDGMTMAIGSPGDSRDSTGAAGDSSAQTSGAVYVFEKSNGTWSQQAYLKASNTQGAARFGGSLALSASGDTLVIGSADESGAGAGVAADQDACCALYSGAAYVFQRVNEQWSQQAYLKASNAEAVDEFGWAVALSGTGDTVVVGATGEDGGGTGIGADEDDNELSGAGAVYVFQRNGSDWAQQAYVKPSEARGSEFGYAVALSKNGDTMVVGAPDGVGPTAGGADADQYTGVAHVFQRSSGAWSEQALVAAAVPKDYDRFGNAVSLSEDGLTLAVGADGEADIGAVHIFQRSGSTWTHLARLTASNGEVDDAFGSAVSLSAAADLIAIGAPGEAGALVAWDADLSDNAAPGAGAVYVFRRDETNWIQELYIKALNAGAGDSFGSAVDLSANAETLVVGAPWEGGNGTGFDANPNDNSSDACGAAYVVH
ncbi:MAG TPA: cadherin-like beta sandwich domain-containing protein, partial [Polyangiaceae bacterium]|nr:cadherin-like beta sandwich domain-containing protein [Polyangiaceae bacterium]